MSLGDTPWCGGSGALKRLCPSALIAPKLTRTWDMTTKFASGTVVSTPNAIATHGLGLISACLARHLAGDWGDLDSEDKASNDAGLNPKCPDRLLSSYKLPNGKLWIITEWDRSVTTALLPEDY